jgi:hypothetical protein
VFSRSSYLASMSLTYLFVSVVPAAGVLWHLVVEVLLYLIEFSIGLYSAYRLVVSKLFI